MTGREFRAVAALASDGEGLPKHHRTLDAWGGVIGSVAAMETPFLLADVRGAYGHAVVICRRLHAAGLLGRSNRVARVNVYWWTT